MPAGLTPHALIGKHKIHGSARQASTDEVDAIAAQRRRNPRSRIPFGPIRTNPALLATSWRNRGMLPVRLACILLQSENQRSTNPLAVEIAKTIFPKFFKLFSKLRPTVPEE